MLIDLLQAFQAPPTIHEASDGTFWRNPACALVHDLIERKWAEFLPTLKDGAVVRATREQLRISQRQLARAAGISAPLLAQIESGHRAVTDENVHKIWGALWAIHQQDETPEILIRLEGDAAVATQIAEECL